ncbi:MAG: ankyrin repeat domain-containing protein [Rickettsiaceae bacterium]|nr:ankyrin repeat domain-containing protein [Rickettsiaceae bacterium]
MNEEVYRFTRQRNHLEHRLNNPFNFEDLEFNQFSAQNEFITPALHRLCQLRMNEEAKSLIKNGYDIETRDRSGFTALHVSSLEGNTEMVQFLLDNGAEIDAVDLSNQTPLHFSVFCNHSETLKTLIISGADTSSRLTYCLLEENGFEFRVDSLLNYQIYRIREGGRVASEQRLVAHYLYFADQCSENDARLYENYSPEDITNLTGLEYNPENISNEFGDWNSAYVLK